MRECRNDIDISIALMRLIDNQHVVFSKRTFTKHHLQDISIGIFANHMRITNLVALKRSAIRSYITHITASCFTHLLQRKPLILTSCDHPRLRLDNPTIFTCFIEKLYDRDTLAISCPRLDDRHFVIAYRIDDEVAIF